ncbi:zinc-dependent peptidase [Flavihumibacter sp. ZG627]|uniref:M90 family metallopeptidase n=1 Tax=Flavihumibacter sp. ZG627 TaxID=1463156 RepID=UPI00057E697D|nr:M90 family metallopeptidase [Flavihumibacter sp. ZG627]KIC91208.1 phenylalanyl-tRNA synthetase subunit alpha [Flavihumibacter sp. ZG627]
MFGVLFFILVVIGFAWWKSRPINPNPDLPVSDIETILNKEVHYFTKLSELDKSRFIKEVISFLNGTRIEGIGTEIDDTDKLLVAASAVIPIFGFPEWHYRNLTDVLIYKNHFNEDFQAEGRNRPYMGMVGSGYMNGKMLLSKTALREGFTNRTDKNNTAIHEFVHLLDKADGSIDGIPEILLAKQYSIPWIDLVHKKMQEIIEDDSDINPYAATDKTEFFAVAAEYFFERPDLLKIHHPKLYEMLGKIFRQEHLATDES